MSAWTRLVEIMLVLGTVALVALVGLVFLVLGYLSPLGTPTVSL